MRRLLVIVLVLGAGAAAVAAAVGGLRTTRDRPTTRSSSTTRSASSTGADVKVAGVRAGHVTGMRVDRRTKRALVDFDVDEDRLRLAAHATRSARPRPQSLIGEYFVDCRPGTAAERLKPGAHDPGRADRVDDPARPRQQHHAPPVPRAPARSSSTSSAPASAAAASDIQETVRRAIPALRETDQVLAILADQNKTLGRPHARRRRRDRRPRGNRKNVGRCVTETRQTARASAERRAQIAASLQRLPAFLRELAADDGQARRGHRRADARARRPQRRPRASSRRCSQNLPDFADASRTGFKSLAELSRDGRPALRSARPTVAELSKFSDEHAGAGQQPRDRPQGPQRPQPRRREGPALAGRQGLHRLRGAPAVRLRPVDGDQRLRLQRLHAEGQPVRVASARTTRTPSRSRRSSRRTRTSTSAAPRSSARTSRASRRPTRRYTGAQDVARARSPAAAKQEARRTQPKAPAAARTPDGAERRRPQGTPSRRSTKARRKAEKLKRAARGHARHPAPRPAADPGGCRRLPAACRQPRRALPTRSSSSTSCSRHEARAPTRSSSAPSRARDDRRRVPGLQRQQRPAVRADHDGQGARGQRREPGQGQRGARGRLPRRRRHRHAPGRARRRVDRRRAHAQARPEATATSRSDSTVRIRPRSALGLKYVELTRGTQQGHVPPTAT